MPSTCSAVVCTATGKAAVQTVPVPQIRQGYLLVKVEAVALNPTDWKSIYNGNCVGMRVGCDYAGVVEVVGPGISKVFKKGDRVCGFVFGGNTDDAESGSFGEYIIAKGDLQIKIPENLSFEDAATLGVGISTVGQGLYQSLNLPLPTSPLASPIPILIYGGSTASGILGIQYAKLSGFTVITTSSPRNFEYLKSLGADVVYDYHVDMDTLAEEIKSFSQNKLTLAWDCSPTPESARLCAKAMSDSDTGHYSSILQIEPDIITSVNPLVKSDFILAYSIFGDAFNRHGRKFEAKPEDFEFGKMFWELSEELLASGRIRVARTAVNQGGSGLDGVLKGLDDLKDGKVSGTKLVYKL